MPAHKLRDQPYTPEELATLEWSHLKDEDGSCFACGRASCRFARFFATIKFLRENKGQMLE